MFFYTEIKMRFMLFLFLFLIIITYLINIRLIQEIIEIMIRESKKTIIKIVNMMIKIINSKCVRKSARILEREPIKENK